MNESSGPGKILLRASRIRKTFPGTVALASVDFDVKAGEIHALLGENGAGKSTLVKVLSGILTPDEGELEVDGAPVRFHSVHEAFSHGIAVVHQELSLMPNFTVAENLCLHAPPYRAGPIGQILHVLDRKEMRRRVRNVAQTLGTQINPNSRVGDLSTAQRQIVEIAKALTYAAKIILLDEPTSSLPPDGRREVFSRLRALRDQGVGIVFITHQLEEAIDLSDRITVLRDGKNTGTRVAGGTTVPELVQMMTGFATGSVFPQVLGGSDTAETWQLQVEGLNSLPLVENVSFALRPGEIVGLAGLMGSGRTETLETIFGLRHLHAGRIFIAGQPVHINSPRAAIRHGLALVPEDRQTQGLFPEHSVERNIALAAVNAPGNNQLTRFGGQVLNRWRSRELASSLVRELKIKTGSIRTPISQLSGGNQQKAIIARWLAIRPRVVLADEPTRGVSIGSKVEIYRLFRALAQQGASIVLVSSEFEELIGLCDRIVLMHSGRSTKEILPRGLDADGLLNLVLAMSAEREHG